MMAYVEMGVRHVHLVSGEDFIGKTFYDGGRNWYRIERPVRPNLNFDPQNQRMHVGLLPALMFSDKDVPLDVKADHVLFVAEVGEQMKRLYQQTVSDLSIAGPEDLKQILKG